MSDHPPFVHDWLAEWSVHSEANAIDSPNYFVSQPQKLLTNCFTSIPAEFDDALGSKPIAPVNGFRMGTGCELTSRIFEDCKATTQELLIVTCFWASSESQVQIHDLLLHLSQKSLRTLSDKIRVRLCFSSLSITQKLFHTASLDGQIWNPSTWSRRLGLPEPEALTGLDLQIKSIFIKPFCVMHPKFVIMDRAVGWLPSCNISWERWLEGCVTFSGALVDRLVEFYAHHWGALPTMTTETHRSGFLDELSSEQRVHTNSQKVNPSCGRIHLTHEDRRQLPCLFLPSPHHLDPKFRLWPCNSQSPPPTPLNTFVLHTIQHATSSIIISTPNFTCSKLSEALLDALARGINVWLLTSPKLMILEQLVTAGTITEYDTHKLNVRYNALVDDRRRRKILDEESLTSNVLGQLKVVWHKPRTEDGPMGPVKSHFKCVLVDRNITILGSGNMDRASWYTSQELGVAFFDQSFADSVKRGLEASWKYRFE